VGGGDDIEWVLNSNTAYGIKLSSTDNRAKTVYGKFIWYEPSLINT
jgi:hypothetical protein